MNWLMGRLNMEELAKDDVYALNYFLDKFVAWAGYQITDAPQLDGTAPASAPQITPILNAPDKSSMTDCATSTLFISLFAIGAATAVTGKHGACCRRAASVKVSA